MCCDEAPPPKKGNVTNTHTEMLFSVYGLFGNEFWHLPGASTLDFHAFTDLCFCDNREMEGRKARGWAGVSRSPQSGLIHHKTPICTHAMGASRCTHADRRRSCFAVVDSHHRHHPPSPLKTEGSAVLQDRQLDFLVTSCNNAREGCFFWKWFI